MEYIFVEITQESKFTCEGKVYSAKRNEFFKILCQNHKRDREEEEWRNKISFIL